MSDTQSTKFVFNLVPTEDSAEVLSSDWSDLDFEDPEYINSGSEDVKDQKSNVPVNEALSPAAAKAAFKAAIQEKLVSLTNKFDRRSDIGKTQPAEVLFAYNDLKDQGFNTYLSGFFIGLSRKLKTLPEGFEKMFLASFLANFSNILKTPEFRDNCKKSTTKEEKAKIYKIVAENIATLGGDINNLSVYTRNVMDAFYTIIVPNKQKYELYQRFIQVYCALYGKVVPLASKLTKPKKLIPHLKLEEIASPALNPGSQFPTSNRPLNARIEETFDPKSQKTHKVNKFYKNKGFTPNPTAAFTPDQTFDPSQKPVKPFKGKPNKPFNPNKPKPSNPNKARKQKINPTNQFNPSD